MLATVFSAVLFTVSFVPVGDVDVAANAGPTCCAKHAYCCTVQAECCGDSATTRATMTEVASEIGRPMCCAKRSYCCSVKRACCGKGATTVPEVEPAELG